MAGNDIGNGLMSIGCLIMLIPVMLILLFIGVAVMLTILQEVF